MGMAKMRPAVPRDASANRRSKYSMKRETASLDGG
jgi:hypothetical protein